MSEGQILEKTDSKVKSRRKYKPTKHQMAYKLEKNRRKRCYVRY